MISYAAIGSEAAFTRRLAAATRAGQSRMVADLGDAAMVGSAVLAALCRTGERLRARGGELTVVSSHPGLARLLELTLMSRSFTLVRTLGPALALES